MRFVPGALLLVAACYNQVDYGTDYDDAWCERYLSCTDPAVLQFAPYDDVKSCVEYRGASFEEDTACSLDRGAARGCVRELAAQSCDDFNAGIRPDACDEVCVSDE